MSVKQKSRVKPSPVKKMKRGLTSPEITSSDSEDNNSTIMADTESESDSSVQAPLISQVIEILQQKCQSNKKLNKLDILPALEEIFEKLDEANEQVYSLQTKNRELQMEIDHLKNKVGTETAISTDNQPPREDFPPLPSQINTPPTTDNVTPMDTDIQPQANTQPANKTNTTTASNFKKVVPIIIRDVPAWNKISQKINEAKANFTNAKATAEGIKIMPSTAMDHRKITKILEANKTQYHTFILGEDRDQVAIIRGLNTQIPIHEIKDDLTEKGFTINEVTWLTRKDKTPMPLLKVRVPQVQSNIFDLAEVCGLIINVERQNPQRGVGQCKNCQLFGHAQINCHAQPRCNKCGEDHHYTKCQKPKDTPATCANCKGPHTANYGGCPKNPKNIKKHNTGKNTNKNPIGKPTRDNVQSQGSAQATPTATKTTNPPMRAQQDSGVTETTPTTLTPPSNNPQGKWIKATKKNAKNHNAPRHQPGNNSDGGHPNPAMPAIITKIVMEKLQFAIQDVIQKALSNING